MSQHMKYMIRMYYIQHLFTSQRIAVVSFIGRSSVVQCCFDFLLFFDFLVFFSFLAFFFLAGESLLLELSLLPSLSSVSLVEASGLSWNPLLALEGFRSFALKEDSAPRLTVRSSLLLLS